MSVFSVDVYKEDYVYHEWQIWRPLLEKNKEISREGVYSWFSKDPQGIKRDTKPWNTTKPHFLKPRGPVAPFAFGSPWMSQKVWLCGLSRHLDHDLVQEVVSSNPAIARKFINSLNYLFDMFIVVQPTFGCPQHPKASRNTQHSCTLFRII